MNPLFAPRALPLTKQWYKQNTRVICSFCSLLESSRQIRQNRSSKAWNPWTNAMMMMIFSRRSFSPFPIFHGNNVLEPPIFGRSSRLSSGYLTGIRTHSVHKILLTSLDKRRPSAAVISPWIFHISRAKRAKRALNQNWNKVDFCFLQCFVKLNNVGTSVTNI